MYLKWKLNKQEKRRYCYLCNRQSIGAESTKDSLTILLGSIPSQPSPRDGLIFIEEVMSNLKNLDLPKKERNRLEEKIVAEILCNDNEIQKNNFGEMRRYPIPTAFNLYGEAVGYCMHEKA